MSKFKGKCKKSREMKVIMDVLRHEFKKDSYAMDPGFLKAYEESDKLYSRGTMRFSSQHNHVFLLCCEERLIGKDLSDLINS